MQINVKDLGAVGDGVTDDTAALKKTLTAEETVYFPAGIYLVREQLFAAGISLHWNGAGRSSVIRLMPSAAAGKIRSFREYDVWDMRLLRLENCREIELRDLTLDANKEAFADDLCRIGSNKSDYTTALDINGADSVTLNGVTCRGGLIEGAYIYRAKQIRIERCSFVDNSFYRWDAAGLQIEGHLTDHPDIRITGCEFSRNGFNGLELTGISGAVVRDILCCENGFDGIAFWNGSSYCRVSGAVCLNNHRAGVTFRRNHSAGAVDVMQDSETFCTDNLIEGLVTSGNAYGVHWGCAARTVIHGWRGADEYSHALCYLYPDRDIRAELSDIQLAPSEGEIYNPIFSPEDGELYEQYGAVLCSDPSRFKR